MTERKILIIGYGNELRGDDAAGARVASQVESWHLPEVEVVTKHQLTPELAEVISEAKAVIFVDASVEARGDQPRMEALEPAREVNLIEHCSEPGALLALAETIYERCPPAWCIHVPAQSFELGAPLSEPTQRAVTNALEQVRALCAESR